MEEPLNSENSSAEFCVLTAPTVVTPEGQKMLSVRIKLEEMISGLGTLTLYR